MNKFFTKIAGLSLGLAMAVGVGVGLTSKSHAKEARADDQLAYTLMPAEGSNNNYGESCDITVSGITWNLTGNSKMIPWRIGGKSISSVVRRLYSKTAIPENINKVIVQFGASGGGITVNSVTLNVYSTDSKCASGGTGDVGSFEVTYQANKSTTVTKTDSKSWSNCFYGLDFNVTVSGSSNKYISLSQCDFYYESAGPSTYTVSYYGNGSESGTVPTDSNQYTSGQEVTVLGNTGSLAKTGHSFAGWNTAADGSGTSRAAGSTFEISDNVNLYAVWSPNPMSLEYDTNGGSGDIPDPTEYDYGTKVEVIDGSGLTYGDFMFNGWNTEADGSGTPYNPGSKITMDNDYVLYAQWAEKPEGFVLVKDINELSDGDTIMLGSKANDVGAGALASQVLTSVAATFSDDVMVCPDALVFTVSEDNGSWTLSTSNGDLGATAVKKLAWGGTSITTWSISIDSDANASITSTTSAYGTMKYNTSSPRFTTYASGQADIQIYKDNSAPDPLESIELGGTVSGTKNHDWNLSGVTVTGTYESGAVKPISNFEATTETPVPTAAGTYDVVVKATVGTVSNTKTYSVTVDNSHSGETLEDAFTVAEALQHTSGTYFVKGIVSKVMNETYSSNYGNKTFWVTDSGTHTQDTEAFEFYRVKWIGGVKMTETQFNSIKVGMTVIGYGTITTYNEQIEFTANTCQMYETPDLFASYLLTATDPICSSSGDNHLTALQGVWTNISNEYAYLTSDQKAEVVSASASQLVKDALARYDGIIGKYNTSTIKNLSEFIENHVVTYNGSATLFTLSSDNTETIIAIVTIMILLASFGGFFYYRKRKEN